MLTCVCADLHISTVTMPTRGCESRRPAWLAFTAVLQHGPNRICKYAQMQVLLDFTVKAQTTETAGPAVVAL